MAQRWSPWRALRHMPHVTMAFAELPNETGGAVLARRGTATVIVLDRRLTQAERKVALAHELLHLERGSTSHCRNIRGALSVEVVREENRIQREVALRLVPLEELGPVVDRLAGLGHGVMAADVAEEFDVPQVVASHALAELATVRGSRPTPPAPEKTFELPRNQGTAPFTP